MRPSGLHIPPDAIDRLPGAVLLLRPGGEVGWANIAARHLLGISGDEVPAGTSILPVVSAADRPLLVERLRSTPPNPLPLVCTVREGDGEDHRVQFHVAPMMIEGEQYLLTLATECDRPRPVQAELRHAQKLEVVGQLAGGIAHDFNNLITAIFGYLDIARRTLGADHPALAAIEGVHEAAEQAAGVTRTLLTFTRKSPQERTRVNLKELVLQSAKLLRRAMPSSIQLITPTDASLDPVWVEADANQIQQVILNLALNARDSLSQGGTIRLSAEYGPALSSTGDDRPRALVIVSDTGGGIPPEVLPRIFDPFFTTKTDSGHSGLGLAIIQDIIRSHDGRIEVKTAIGQGTTFRVSFPSADAPADTTPAERVASAQASGELLLIVEDDALVRQIIASQLRQFGYSVMEAGAAEVAASLAEQNRSLISLVICDLELPDMPGDQLVDRLRGAGVTVPVVLITGSIQFDPTALEKNGVTILRKPFGVARLAETVSKVLSVGSARTSSATVPWSPSR